MDGLDIFRLSLLAVNIAAATVVVGLLALAAARFSRQASLPLQHGILCLALLIILASPASAWLCLRENVGLLPVDFFALDFDSDSQSLEDLDVPFEFPVTSDGGSSIAVESITADLVVTRPDELPAELVASDDPATPSESFASLLIGAIALPPVFAGILFFFVWTIGGLWKSSRLVSGLFVVRRLRRSLRAATDPRVVAAAARVLATASLRRAPNVAESPLAPAPLTLGWLRPVIVIPEGLSKTLSDEQLACILAHELAHVKRRDAWIALLQELAAVVFWWNPLLHAINRQIRRLRERLCDDFAVLHHGSSVALAQALVHVAQWSAMRPRTARFTSGLLDNSGDLEERIHRLTETGRAVELRWSGRSVGALCTFGMLASALMALPIIRPNGSDTGDAIDFDVPEYSRLPPEIPVERALDKVSLTPAEPAEVTISGHVRTTDRNPVAGARVYLLSMQGDDRREDPDRPLAVTQTDAKGFYQFRDAALPMHGNPWMKNRFGIFQICAEREEYGIAWCGSRSYVAEPGPADLNQRSEHEFYQGEPIELDLTLLPARSLTGRIVDEQGQPVAGATIHLRNLDYLDTRNREHQPNAREFRGLCLMPEQFRQAESDADGQFEIRGLPAESVAHLIVEHPELAMQWLLAANTDSPATENRYIANDGGGLPIWETRMVRPSPIEVRLRAVRQVLVKVVHPNDESPAPGVSVSASATAMGPNSEALAQGTTDDQGQVTLRLPPGKYQVYARPKDDSDDLLTMLTVEVDDRPDEQTFRAPLTKGCRLILEVVDAATGEGIADVTFLKGRGMRGILGQGTSFRTDANGRCRALVPPGTPRYAVELGSIPNSGNATPFDYRSVTCEAGQTARLRFEIRR